MMYNEIKAIERRVHLCLRQGQHQTEEEGGGDGTSNVANVANATTRVTHSYSPNLSIVGQSSDDTCLIELLDTLNGLHCESKLCKVQTPPLCLIDWYIDVLCWFNSYLDAVGYSEVKGFENATDENGGKFTHYGATILIKEGHHFFKDVGSIRLKYLLEEGIDFNYDDSKPEQHLHLSVKASKGHMLGRVADLFNGLQNDIKVSDAWESEASCLIDEASDKLATQSSTLPADVKAKIEALIKTSKRLVLSIDPTLRDALKDLMKKSTHHRENQRQSASNTAHTMNYSKGNKRGIGDSLHFVGSVDDMDDVSPSLASYTWNE
jgi:hypothetical protein